LPVVLSECETWSLTFSEKRRLRVFKFDGSRYRTIILPVVLSECETWSPTFREERRLRVFENRLLMRIFGSTRDEVKREWKKLYNEELNDLYYSPNTFGVIKSRRVR
jgi:hypothetical protein